MRNLLRPHYFGVTSRLSSAGGLKTPLDFKPKNPYLISCYFYLGDDFIPSKNDESYADDSHPRGKYKIGTRIEITKSKYKVGNGTFEITLLFPKQGNGDDAYFHYRRVLKSGAVSRQESTANLRGNWGSTLDRIAKIIKPPTKQKPKAKQP